MPLRTSLWEMTREVMRRMLSRGSGIRDQGSGIRGTNRINVDRIRSWAQRTSLEDPRRDKGFADAEGRSGLERSFRSGYYGHVKKASITEAKNNFSALIDKVKAGSPVLIVDRGRPVARLEPVNQIGADDDHRLARLVRDGVLRPARRAPAREIAAGKPVRSRKGTSIVRALLDERRRGR
jgi:prevent-host-death family protein